MAGARRFYFPLTFVLAVFAAGCGYRVAIIYLKPRGDASLQAAIANVYMIVARPQIPGAETLTKLGLHREADLPIELDVDRLGQAVSAQLAARGGRLSAYRVR